MSNEYNPIQDVGGIKVPCPSSYRWKLSDISAEGAGRCEDGNMDKKRIGQTIGVELAWSGLSNSEAAKVLQAFDPEYIDVTYLDAKAGGYITKNFYVGDRAAPLWNAQKGVWESISFNLITKGVS